MFWFGLRPYKKCYNEKNKLTVNDKTRHGDF